MKRGFTLIELAIVLTIIGVIAGGIMVGTSLITSSRVSAQIAQFKQYDIAATNFKNAIKQLPGDCTSCGHNADNDGKLGGDGEDSWPVPPTHMMPEAYYYFIDLYTKGFTEERFAAATNTYNIGTGQQFPKAAIGRGGMIVSGNNSNEVYYLFMAKDMTLTDGGAYTTVTEDGNFTPNEAIAIDRKIDDAIPYQGDVIVHKLQTGAGWYAHPMFYDDTNTGCIKSNKYDLTIDKTICRLSVKAIIQ